MHFRKFLQLGCNKTTDNMKHREVLEALQENLLAIAQRINDYAKMGTIIAGRPVSQEPCASCNTTENETKITLGLKLTPTDEDWTSCLSDISWNWNDLKENIFNLFTADNESTEIKCDLEILGELGKAGIFSPELYKEFKMLG